MRGSFTRDDRTTMSATPVRARSGESTSTARIQPGVTMISRTRSVTANARMPATNTVAEAIVIASAGISAARIFPSSSSQVRIGVARTGSSVRSRFSPTIAYDASTEGMKIGRSRKRIENCRPTIAWATSSGARAANSAGRGPPCGMGPESFPTAKNPATASTVMTGGRNSVARSNPRCSRSSSHSLSRTMSALFTRGLRRAVGRRPQANAEDARRSECARRLPEAHR